MRRIRKIIAVLLLGMFLFTNYSAASAFQNEEDFNNNEHKFFFCSIVSKGSVVESDRDSRLLKLVYDGSDPNSTTTIKGFFRLRTIGTFTGNHTLIISFFIGRKDISNIGMGEVLVIGKGLMVKIIDNNE